MQRSVYLSLLVERPLALSQLVRLCSGSVLIANHVQRYPLVIDEMLDCERCTALERQAWRQSFRATRERRGRRPRTGDGDAQAGEANERAAVAAADLAQALPLMVVSDHLTEIAEVCVDNAVTLAWRDITERHGEPTYQ